jgi:hypothetical protein
MWIAYARTVRPLQEVAQDAAHERIVWVAIPGPNGGGGGRRAPAQPRPEPPQAVRTADAPTPMRIPLEHESPQEAAEPQPPALVNMADIAMAGAANAPEAVTGDSAGQGLGSRNRRWRGTAARRWLFRPGTRGGEPVPVLVSLEIAFNIH